MREYEIIHMDQFIDDLLREERVLDIKLPRIQKRHVLAENGELDPKIQHWMTIYIHFFFNVFGWCLQYLEIKE